jgi:signal transduction histidine kinase/AraC-like DNA-binding protein
MSYLAVIALLIYVYIRRREYNLINDKIRLESEIKAATAELERKNLQLAEIDRIKTHFFTDIAHEIRTPLSLILGPIEQMSKEGTDDRKMPGMVDLMKRNAHRLMNLVNQLLDISRLDAGKMKITLTEDDIVKFIRMLVYEFLSLADTKQIKYIADLPEMSFIVLFDRDKIEKIITNLLSNAFKYTPRNGTVHCIIRIETGNNNVSPLLKIRVTDTGHGIGEEHHFKIFERFYRVEGHHETEGYGTGIGLSLVQEFVTLLQGEIRVASAPGKGSDFSVIIPLGKGHLSPEDYVIAPTPSSVPENRVVITHHDRRESETGNTVPKGRMQLLIIEDNEDLRTFIRQTLDHEYVIFDSENGKTGLNTAFTMMPDLIVTDIMMPDIDGLELCAILKNDERTSHIPVIMLTAKSTSEDKIAGLKTGADDYVVKPFNMTELSARISNLLVMRSRLKQKYSRFHLPEERKKPPESVDDRFMMRVIKTINAKIGDDAFDVGALTEHLGMSRTHLTRKLKILTGMSPGTIIRNIRLEKAAELLLEKTGNITEVANTVGISNPSHFTRAFRHYFGVSPRKYLNRPVP